MTQVKKQVNSSKDVLHDFVRWFSGHGYRRIILADTVLGKIIWVTITAICTILFITQCVRVLNLYLEYPTSVTTHRVEESPDFPVVTICNMNPIKRSVVPTSLAQFTTRTYTVTPHSGYQGWYDVTAAPTPASTAAPPAVVTTGYETSSSTPMEMNATTKDMMVTTAGMMVTEDVNTTGSSNRTARRKRAAEELRTDRKTFISAVSSLSATARKAAEHQKRDMILSCTFGSAHCDRDMDFEYFYHARYGACYSFNMAKNASKVLIQPGIGPTTGLQLILNAEVDEYLDDIPESDGIRVAIHRSRTRPPMEELGFTIPPLTTASVNMRMKFVERPGDPYVACRDPDAPKKKTRFAADKDSDPYAYSVSECMSNCAQERILIDCQCVTDPVITPQEVLCGFSNEECIEKVLSDVKSVCGSSCAPPCKDNVYTYSISQADWPAQQYWDTVVETIRGLSTAVDADIANGLITKSVLQLKIFFGDVGYDSHEEEASYTLPNVLADVGGISALFIGWSVITIAEFIQLMVLLCTYKLCGYETDRGAPATQHTAKSDRSTLKTPIQNVHISSPMPTPSHRAARPLQPVQSLTLANRMKVQRMRDEY